MKKIPQVLKVMPVPTTSLRNLLAKSQSNITLPSSFATNLHEQHAFDRDFVLI